MLYGDNKDDVTSHIVQASLTDEQNNFVEVGGLTVSMIFIQGNVLGQGEFYQKDN